MHEGSEWAETVSAKIWSAPVCTPSQERLGMDVDWENRRGLQGYLLELWHGIRGLGRRLHAYTRLKQA